MSSITMTGRQPIENLGRTLRKKPMYTIGTEKTKPGKGGNAMQDEVRPFSLPRVVLLGVGASKRLGEQARLLGGTKAMVITDRGILKTGLVDRLCEQLAKEGLKTAIFSDVQPEPPLELVDACVAEMQTAQVDLVVAVGGGSCIDVAKGVAIIATNGGSIRDYLGVDNVPRRGLPTIMLPTTSGTGAEMTRNAIFTDKAEKLKKAVVSQYLIPDVAIIDSLLTVTSPPEVTAFTGMDALTHAVESYTSVNATFHTDMYAIEAIRSIGSSLRTAVANGTDIGARSQMARGSAFAGISLANAGVGAVHALAYPLGARFGLAHGLANAILLPHVMRHNFIGNLVKFAAIAEALGEVVDGMSCRDAAARSADAIAQLSADIGIPQSLRDLGVLEEEIASMASAAVSNSRLMANNPRQLSAKEAEAIYRAAY